MPWEITTAILAIVIPYVLFIEKRMADMSDKIAKRPTDEEVKEIASLSQERLIERIENMREDVKELKEEIRRLVGISPRG